MITTTPMGRIGHEAEFVDTTGNRKGKQHLPLGEDMDPDWPREDIPNHSGALSLKTTWARKAQTDICHGEGPSLCRILLGPGPRQAMLRTTGLDRRLEVIDRI